MSPRLAKEVRPLLLPWVFALLACLAVQLLSGISPDIVPVALGWLVIPLCGAFLAARTFAFEFQDRTLALWLSQPVTRADIWREKFRVLIPAEMALAALLLINPDASSHYSGERHPVIGLLSLAASVATAPFWATIARSTIGTLVFTLAFQYIAAVAVLLLISWMNLPTVGDFSASKLFRVGCYLTFTGGLLLAGRRRFATLEAIEGIPTFGDALTTLGPKSSEPTGLGLLRPRPRGLWRNLLRKELHLHRPSFILATVFVVSVLLVALVDTFTTGASQPVREVVDVLRVLPFMFYGVALTLLAGMTSFCEEKSLGTEHLALTQPHGPLRQFLAKLAASSAVFSVLGLLLPILILLAYGSANADFGGLLAQNQRTAPYLIPAFAALMLIGFLVSFWISSLLPNVVRAGLTTLILISAGIMATGVIYVSTSQEMPSLPFDRKPWVWTLTNQTLWSGYGPKLIDVIGGALVLLFILGLLVTSYRNFRHVGQPLRRTVRQVAGFFALLCLGVLCFGTVREVENRNWKWEWRVFNGVQEQVVSAVQQLEAANPNRNSGVKRTYDWRQMEATGRLDAATIARYAGVPRTVSVIDVDSDWLQSRFPGKRHGAVTITPPLMVIEESLSRWGRGYLVTQYVIDQDGRRTFIRNNALMIITLTVELPR